MPQVPCPPINSTMIELFKTSTFCFQFSLTGYFNCSDHKLNTVRLEFVRVFVRMEFEDGSYKNFVRLLYEKERKSNHKYDYFRKSVPEGRFLYPLK